MRRPILLLLVGLAAASVGCKKLRRPKIVDAGAPPVVSPLARGKLTPVATPYELKFSELPSARLWFSMVGTRYEVRGSGFPSGATIEIDGRRSSLSSSSSGDGVELGDKIADLRPEDAIGYRFKLDPKVDFTVEVPGYDPTTSSLPPRDVTGAVRELFLPAVNRPVHLPGEVPTAPAPSAAHTILYISRLGFAMDVFGPAATLREVDWVAVAEQLAARRGPTCLAKRSGSTGPAAPVDLSLVDSEVLLAERRTARIVVRKTFPAVPTCPSTVYDATPKVYADEAEIKRWLRDVRTTAK